jgi:hypothetical protein
MLILKPISDGAVLAVLAAPECDLGLVSHEIVLLGEQAARILTPEVRRQLTAARSRQQPVTA